MSPDRQGSPELHVRIARLRDAARAEVAAEPASQRKQLGLEDSAIQVATRLAGTHGADRRQAMKDVQVGRTVTAKGDVAKTRLTREEKAAWTLRWAKTLTEDQREQLILSERFEGLSDSQQEAISEAFAEVTDREYSDSIGIQEIDYDAETPDVDSIIGSLDEDADEADDDSGSDFDAVFEQAEWQGEAS
jgi:hypothetical protein